MDKIISFVKSHKILTALLIAIIAVVGWWQYEFPSATWRYKMTVTVETPDGVKTGSAVREVTFTKGPKILPEARSVSWRVQGEAVVVDMGQDQYLFAIMDVDGSYKIVYDAFPYTPKSARDSIRYYKSITGQKKTLDQSQYPTLVTFTDTKDPKSVTQVDANNLAATFGTGVKLKDITIEMTDEDVTWEVDKYLVWLNGLQGGYLSGEFTARNSPMGLLGGNFKRGDYK